MLIPLLLVSAVAPWSPVPVVVCGSAAGLGANHAAPPDPSLEVALPAALADRLAAYWVWTGEAYLAPRGLQCEAKVGTGDGSVLLKIGRVHRGHLRAAVTVRTEFGCEGCKRDEAACFFRRARRSFVEDREHPPVCHRPAAERRIAKGRDLVLFEDPPGVAGTGDASGGALRAHGVLYFDGIGGRATCALPERDRTLCTAILNHFIRVERATNKGFNG